MLLRVSKIFLYVALFAVIVVMTSTFFPFIGGKDYFFRFSVELALIFFILWLAFEAKNGEAWRRVKTVSAKPFFIAVSLFALVFLLASVFAYDPNAGFWSNYERGEGGFQMIHYYLFFALLALLMENENDWRWVFRLSLAAGALMILYGFVADMGWADNFISAYQGGPVPCAPQSGVPPCSLFETFLKRLTVPRFQGSLGNPAYVAPYLLFSIFYAAYLWAGNKLRKNWKRILCYGALIAFLSLFFFLSETRGAFIGLAAAILAFIFYLAIFNRAWRKWLIAAVVVLALATGLMIQYRHSDFVKKLPGGRNFDIAFSDQTVQTRFWTWGSAWKGFSERPALGWGPENFSAVFDKYFDPRHYIPGQDTETWFDRAHSLFFDYLSETGILGLLSFLGIFAAFYVVFFKKQKGGGAGGPSSVQRALVFALPIGYLVQGLAIFDVLPIYINVFLFYAFSYWFFYGQEKQAPDMQVSAGKRQNQKFA